MNTTFVRGSILFLFFTNATCALWGVRTPRLISPTTTTATTTTKARTKSKLDTKLTLHLADPQLNPIPFVSSQTVESCRTQVNRISPLTPTSRLLELQKRVSMIKPKVFPAEKAPASCRSAATFPEYPILPAGPAEEAVRLQSRRRKRQTHIDGCCHQDCFFGPIEVAELDIYGYANVQIYNGVDEQQYFHQCKCKPTPISLCTGSCQCVQEYRAQFALVQRSPNGQPVKSWIYVPSCCRSEITL